MRSGGIFFYPLLFFFVNLRRIINGYIEISTNYELIYPIMSKFVKYSENNGGGHDQ